MTQTLGQSPGQAAEGAARPGPRLSVTLSALTLDSGCCRQLNWRCDLAPPLPAEALEPRFLARGFSSRCQHPALRVLGHPEGHEVAWVLTSGRFQIRISPIIEESQRKTKAQQIHGLISSFLRPRAEGGLEAETEGPQLRGKTRP